MRFVDTKTTADCAAAILAAAILAAAKAARSHRPLSEDFNHGQDYDGVVVVNPFLS